MFVVHTYAASDFQPGIHNLQRGREPFLEDQESINFMYTAVLHLLYLRFRWGLLGYCMLL